VPDLDVDRLTTVIEDFNTIFIRLPSVRRLNFSALSVLHTLGRRGPLRLIDLLATEQLKQPALTSLVAKLEQDGLLQRRPDPADGRASLLSLTRTGRELHARRGGPVGERHFRSGVDPPGNEVEAAAFRSLESRPEARADRQRASAHREHFLGIHVGLLLVVHGAARDDDVPVAAIELAAVELVGEERARRRGGGNRRDQRKKRQQDERRRA